MVDHSVDHEGEAYGFAMLNELDDTPASTGAIQRASAKLTAALDPLAGVRL